MAGMFVLTSPLEIFVCLGASEGHKWKGQGELCGSGCQKLKWFAMESTLLFILFFCFGHSNLLSLSPVSVPPSLSFLDPCMCHFLYLEYSLHLTFLHCQFPLLFQLSLDATFSGNPSMVTTTYKPKQASLASELPLLLHSSYLFIVCLSILLDLKLLENKGVICLLHCQIPRIQQSTCHM